MTLLTEHPFKCCYWDKSKPTKMWQKFSRAVNFMTVPTQTAVNFRNIKDTGKSGKLINRQKGPEYYNSY